MRRVLFWLALGLNLWFQTALAQERPLPRFRTQQDSLTVFQLPPVLVEATRGFTAPWGEALPLLTLERRPPEVQFRPALTLTETLHDLPGLWLNDRQNYALGERLLVRSAGWQAAFGVRGVQVVLDGIPLTMPDGQAVLDPVDPAFIRRAELLRGPAALFWGNGSAGALVLSTWPEPIRPGLRVRLLGGSYGLRRLGGEAVLRAGPHALAFHASHLEQEGYRAHSQTRLSRFGLQAGVRLDARSRLRVTLAGAWLDARHPGALTADELARDPRQASARYVATHAGKESRQGQLGATFVHRLPAGWLTFTTFALVRHLDNPLPFAYIRLQRQAAGMRTTWTQERGRWRTGLGLDVTLQDDDRQNFPNNNGRPGTPRLLDQRERVGELALFGLARYAFTPRLQALAGLRLSYLHFALTDYLLTNGDQSGRRTFSVWTPTLGLTYQIMPGTQLFATLGTAFESPTTTELVNRPDGRGGFNPELEPQYLYGIELGGRRRGSMVQADLTLFYQWMRGRIIPFQLEGDGRTFYRNAGRTRQYGIELWLQARLTPALQARLAYTGARYRFEETELRDKRLPGLPEQHLALTLQYRRGPLWLETTGTAVGPCYADDANTVRVDGYVTLDVTLGLARSLLPGFDVRPFVSVQNVLDQRYVGSVVVNAGGGRYFEPAAGRSVRFGLNLSTP